MELAGAIIAAVAALAAIASAFIAWRQKRAADTAATDARRDAAEAATAAQRAVTAAEASATAHTKLAEIAETEATAPPWKIEAVSDSTYAARNGGPIRLYDVAIAVTGFASSQGQSTAETVDRGASLRFIAIATMTDPEVSVTITWAEESGGAQRSWTDQIS